MTIFFSWQSNIKAAACRTLIEDALRAAAADLVVDGHVSVEPVIDRDTQNVPGAPDIGGTIFAKIDAAAAFVADVTIVGKAGDRPTPNPNVLIELGYALKSMKESRIVLVQNTALGGPEDLPFDLRQKRVLRFSSPVDVPERSSERKRLQKELKGALALVLGVSRSVEAEIEAGITHRMLPTSTGDIHHYELDVCLKNVGRRRIDDWEIDTDFPTPLMEPNILVGTKVADQSNSERSRFRVQGREIRKPLRPGEEFHARIGYRVDDAIYDAEVRGETHLFDSLARARILVDGNIAAEVERPIRELQNF